ncbi:MAG: hypothetical protein ACT4P7_01415 [Gemmatimonadaceae bacterium]
MLNQLLFAEGGSSAWWYAWYVVLWVEVLPFVVMALRLFLPKRHGLVAPESVALNGAVLAASVLMILTSLVAVILYMRSGAGPSIAQWALGLAIHFVVWAFLGSAMLFAAFQALGSGSSLRARRLAAAGSTIGALLIHGASLYATWLARIR